MNPYVMFMFVVFYYILLLFSFQINQYTYTTIRPIHLLDVSKSRFQFEYIRTRLRLFDYIFITFKQLFIFVDTIATDYFLTIDQINNRLFKVINSTEIASVDTGVINPLSVAVDHKRITIVWIDQTGNSIKSINNDGTSETTLTTGKH